LPLSTTPLVTYTWFDRSSSCYKSSPAEKECTMRFPRFRIFTWVILAINAIFLIWIIVGISTRPNPDDTASNVGTAIGAGLIIGLWVAADLILGILWLITKPKTRDCPVCGRTVKRGQMECKGCGYDFAQAARFNHEGGQSPPSPA
jgi:hypothetical protein